MWNQVLKEKYITKQMTEEYNNNNNEDSSEAIHKLKRISQNKELLKVLEALVSPDFRPLAYQEDWF